jgi:bifunctional non-homologous end joining protein LigD
MEIQAEHRVNITNPDKVLWPEANVTKMRYMKYLADVSAYMLPHIRSRPVTMIRYPNGIHGPYFYQKDKPKHLPDWVETIPIWSAEREDYIHAIVADSVATLLWLANLACLELHVGFTTMHNKHEPTAVAFDLDPSVPGFEPVAEVALRLHELLERLALPHAAKTSGATGLQVFIPLKPGHTFEQTRIFTKFVAEYLHLKLPNVVTLERLTKNRGQKVYIDYPQHGQNRTLIAVYSTRATAHATVSTPVLFRELAEGVRPEDFTIYTVPDRIRKLGDLMYPDVKADLQEYVRFLKKRPNASL